MSPIDPLGTPLDAGRVRTDKENAAELRAARAEVEFRAMLVRELLRPLTEELLPDSDESGFGGGGAAGGPGSSGTEMYGFFLEEALAEHLAERWPLPTPDSARGSRGPASAPESSSAVNLPRTGAPIPLSRGQILFELDRATRPLPMPSSATTAIPVVNGPETRIAGVPVLPGASIAAAIFSAGSGNASREIAPGEGVDAVGSALNPAVPAGHTGLDPADADMAGTARPGVPASGATSTRSAMSSLGEASSAATSSVDAARGAAVNGADSRAAVQPRRFVPNLPDDQIQRAARLFDLPDSLVRAVVLTESGGRADAVSKKGAIGLMQVMPGTARDMGVTNPRDPWENLYAGAKYLRRQLDRFGSLSEALAAYNAGPGAVERHGGVPPYRETREYVEKVLDWMHQLESGE